MSGTPQRVTVTGSQIKLPRARSARGHYPAAGATDRQTELGELRLRSLMRSQLRLGLATCLSICGALAFLPIAFLLFPAVSAALAWLVLGLLVYPTLVGVGWFYVRRAEHNERQFAELVRHS